MGFRPQRDCKEALREVDRWLKEGYTHVVDADITSYFDSIEWERLLERVRERISDGRMLELIEAFLRHHGTGVFKEDCRGRATHRQIQSKMQSSFLA